MPYPIASMRFTGAYPELLKIGESADFFCIGALVRPIVGREAYPPKAGIGFGEFERRVELFGLRGRDKFYGAFGFFAGPHVEQRNRLALIQRDAQFHKRAMRVHNDRVSFLAEGFICEFPLHHHANLEKQALAASFARSGFHYSAASRISEISILGDIKLL